MQVRRLMVLGGIAGCLVSAGCGSSNDNKSDTAAASGSAASGSSGKSYSVGLVGFSSADLTSQQALTSYVAEAKKKGWKTIVIDAQGSPDKAIGGIQNLVQKKVDAIFTSVFPAESMAGGVLAAKAAKIPVFSLAGGTGPGVESNWNAGKLDGDQIAAELVKDAGGKGAALALGYTPGLPCRLREAALKSAIKPTTMQLSRQEIKIPGAVESGTTFTQAWLAKHPKNSGPLAVWGCNGDAALGATAALRQAGRTDVKVYGINGQPAELKNIQAKTQTATAWLDATKAGVEMVAATPKMVANGVDSPPLEENIPSVLVNQQNVADFVAQHPDAAKTQ
ncbi:MAG: ribose transport system substrate-binding protein, partial [Baekduia sp.]|jgi:ABC-type sugar transport system substrate-binding protein|nr:ribose transport system substrate-binding protein [Baekduia sp.]